MSSRHYEAKVSSSDFLFGRVQIQFQIQIYFIFSTEHKLTRYMQMKWQYIEIIQNNYMHITLKSNFEMFDEKNGETP